MAVPAAQPPRRRRDRPPARRGGLAPADDSRRARRRPRLAAGVSAGRIPGRAADPDRPADRESLELAIERMRFALGVDEDLTEFARTFRGDPLIGEIIHHRPWLRPRRRPWPWEALAWAVTEQLIEVSRAVEIQRRVVRRWGGKLDARRSGVARPGAAARRAGPRGGRRGRPGRARRLRPGAVAGDRADPLRARGRRGPRRPRPRRGRPPPGRGSPGSAPGRCRCSASTAAASRTRCPPATSPTSSWSGRSPASAAARRSRRSRSTSPLRAVSRPRRLLRARPLARHRRPGPAAAARGLGVPPLARRRRCEREAIPQTRKGPFWPVARAERTAAFASRRASSPRSSSVARSSSSRRAARPMLTEAPSQSVARAN